MKKLKFLSAILITSLISVSCIVDDEIEKDQELFNGSLITGFESEKTLANFVQESGAVFNFGIPVNVIGGAEGQPSNSKITMTYELGTLDDLNLTPEEKQKILDNNIAAVEGTHYDFTDTVRESVIEANGDTDLIPVNIYNDALDGAKTTYFVLNLKTVTAVDDVVLGEQLKSTLVTIQLCRTDLAGSYTVQYGSGPQTHTVTNLGNGNYELSSMFGWPTSGYTSYFYACAGELVFTSWTFSNEIIQGIPGYVNANGQLVFEQFGIENVYSDNTYTMTPN